MRIVIMDGQGGGVGKQIAERLKDNGLAGDVIVVGTNAVATSNMMKAGIAAGATGENAVAYNCARADIIVGPIGIIVPNAMYGEITPAMVMAVGESEARKILIPVQNMHIHIAGMEQKNLTECVKAAVAEILAAL